MTFSGIQVFAMVIVAAGAAYFIVSGGTFTLLELIAGQAIGTGIVWFCGSPPKRQQNSLKADDGSGNAQ